MRTSMSFSPRTVEELARSRRARWKHGLCSAETRAEHRRARELLIQSRELLKQIRADCFTVHGVHPTVSLLVLR